MKKRIFAMVILALMLLPALCLTVFAAETGTPFPYNKYPDSHFSFSTAYPAWERDLREKEGHLSELCYTVPFYVRAFKQWWTDVDEETFDSMANSVASQSGTLEIDKVPGMWEAKEALGENDGQVSVSWDIQDHADNYMDGYTSSNKNVNSQTLIKQYEDEFNNHIALSDIEGTVSTHAFHGGTLVETHWERVRGGTYKGSEYFFIRPIPEIPEAFVYYYFRIRDSHNDGTYHESVIAEWEQWKDRLFTANYDVIWKDDFRDYANQNNNSQAGVTQNAEENPGEDGGVSVPAAIVIGVLGGGAAIAGAAAASGGADDKKRTQKTYKMYVQKDFGDAIRRGGDKPVIIRARMAEVEGTTERDRNDLTALIAVSADGMTVHGAALAGRYCEATVSVQKEYDGDTASITFTFAGEGGSFTNTVIFRVVDGPQLKFIDESDGTLYGSGCGIDAIPGDGFTYTERFAIVDAPVAPKLSDITAVNTGEFDVEFELTDRPAVYRMNVKNNTKPEPDHDIFEKPKDKSFEIRVAVEGEKEPVKGYVTVTLYPEGITVSSTMEGKKKDVKYVRVQAYEKEYAGDLDKKWQVSEIKFTLAHTGKDKAIIDPKEAEYKFEKIKGAGGKGTRADKEQSLAEKYEYKESWGDWNDKFIYTFEPQAHLCEPDDGSFYVVLLPVKCEYDGVSYDADIPLRLKGKDPDPFENWDAEYKKLKERIEKYSLPEDKEMWLKKMDDLALEPRSSTQQLRLTSKIIVRNYMRYWLIEGQKYRIDAEIYDSIVSQLEWLKFFGDCAFSLLVTAYAGPVAEALISPAKDFATGAIGEIIAAWNHGETIDFSIMDRFEFSKNLAAAGDNLVSGSISLTNWKMAAATLGCYFVYASIKNYLAKLNEGENDLYGALVSGFSDMTVQALKAGAAKLLEMWMKSSKVFQEKIGPVITKYFKETKFSNLQQQYNQWQQLYGDLALKDASKEATVALTDIISKYISELVGAGASYIEEKTLEQVKTTSAFGITAEGHITFAFTMQAFKSRNYQVTLDINKIIFNMTCPLFGWLYDYLFGQVPFAVTTIDPPKDPPLPPEKK